MAKMDKRVVMRKESFCLQVTQQEAEEYKQGVISLCLYLFLRLFFVVSVHASACLRVFSFLNEYFYLYICFFCLL